MTVFKISKRTAAMTFMCLVLFLGVFRICIFSNTIFKIYSIMLLGSMMLILARNTGRWKRNRFVIFLAAVVALSVINKSFHAKGFMNALTYFLQFISVYFVADYIAEYYGPVFCLKCFAYASVCICTCMDISVLLGMSFDPQRYQNLTTYLFGNKFMVSYLHMQALGICAAYAEFSGNAQKTSWKAGLSIYAVFGIVVSAIAECSTGIIGNAVIFLMLIFPFTNRMKRFFSMPFVMMLALLVANILLIGSDVLLQLPPVQYIIVNILHEDLTLTGRFYIYNLLAPLIKDEWLLGYGYNSDLITNMIGYGNAQNGVFQYVLDCGIAGLVCYLANWVHSVKSERCDAVKNWPLVCTVYGFIVCSLVEVCFKFNFLIILALMACMNMHKSQKGRPVIS